MVSGLGCAAQTIFPSFLGSRILSPAAASPEVMLTTWINEAFKHMQVFPLILSGPARESLFFSVITAFFFLEHYVIPSPKGDFPANNDPCRPPPESFIFKPSWPDTPGPSLFFPTYLEDNHKATVSLAAAPLHRMALKPHPGSDGGADPSLAAGGGWQEQQAAPCAIGRPGIYPIHLTYGALLFCGAESLGFQYLWSAGVVYTSCLQKGRSCVCSQPWLAHSWALHSSIWRGGRQPEKGSKA